MSYESGKVTADVTGSVSTDVPHLPTGATQIVARGTSTGAGMTTVYTVTAGKTLYITAFNFVYGSGAGTTQCSLQAEFSTGVFTALCEVIHMAAYTTPFSMNLGIPMAIGPGLIVRINNASASTNCFVTIFGYEV